MIDKTEAKFPLCLHALIWQQKAVKPNTLASSTSSNAKCIHIHCQFSSQWIKIDFIIKHYNLYITSSNCVLYGFNC